MPIAKFLNDLKRQKKLIALVGGFFIALAISSVVIIYLSGVLVTRNLVDTASATAQGDINYSNGSWDTTKYDADTQIPGANRVYLITKQGFVIDRWRPIPGYLDTSDFKELSAFQQPTTVSTVTGQTWQIYSQPINDTHNDVIGLITVGKNITSGSTITAVDQHLMQAAAEIQSKLTLHGQTINASKVTEDDVPFLTPFQVVSQYNEILTQSDYSSTADHLPNYLDPSYIVTQLTKPTLSVVRSTATGEAFLVRSVPLLDANSQPIGTLIVARTLEPFISLLKFYSLIILIVGIVLIAATGLVARAWKVIPDEPEGSTTKHKLTPGQVKHIGFSKTDSQLIINEEKLQLTYASNQYYICLAIFSAPKKKWAADELTEKLGIQHGKDSWRKIYDAVISINKRFGTVAEPKLIVTNNKTYQINPELISKL